MRTGSRGDAWGWAAHLSTSSCALWVLEESILARDGALQPWAHENATASALSLSARVLRAVSASAAQGDVSDQSAVQYNAPRLFTTGRLRSQLLAMVAPRSIRNCELRVGEHPLSGFRSWNQTAGACQNGLCFKAHDLVGRFVAHWPNVEIALPLALENSLDGRPSRLYCIDRTLVSSRLDAMLSRRTSQPRMREGSQATALRPRQGDRRHQARPSPPPPRLRHRQVHHPQGHGVLKLS